ASVTVARLSGLVSGVSYDVSLHWYSADGIAQDTAAVVSGGVETLANNVPVLAAMTFNRAENIGPATTASGVAVATLVATDADRDQVAYSIVGGADALLFAIDAQSGVVRLARPVNFDHEIKDSYTFNVLATDIYGGSSGAVAQILSIDDVAEGLALPVQYAQTAVAGTADTFMVRLAEDLEGGNPDVIYQAELANGEPLPSWLTVSDFTTGEFSVGANAVPGVYRIRVMAMLASGRLAGHAVALNEPAVASDRLFELSVIAAGNSVPDFSRATRQFDLAEGEFLSGHALGTVAARDTDRITYSLRGDDAIPFAIGKHDGALSLAQAWEFDYEGKTSWKFVVDAQDGNGGLASTEVEVRITGVNEAPEFLAAQAVYQVVGRRVTTFTVRPAVDPEGDSISYTASDPGAWLTFTPGDPPTFRVAANAPVGAHPVTVTGSAIGGSVEHELVIAVQASGNRTPEFAVAALSLEPADFTAGQTVASGMAIGDVTATDADGHAINYRIVSGQADDAALFAVDGQSGRLELAVATTLADRVYRFTVEAYDGNGGVARIRVEVAVQAAEPERTQIPAVSETESVIGRQDEVAAAVMDRALAVAAVEILARRLNAPPSAAGSHEFAQPGEEPAYMRMASATDQWSSWRLDHERGLDRSEPMSWRDFLSSRGLDLALDDAGSRGALRRVWAFGSSSSLDGSPTANGIKVAYDGSARVLMMGVEMGWNETRLGVALGNSQAKLTLGEAAAGQQVERKLNVAYPYLSFPINERIRMWATGGYGSGEYVRKGSSQDAAQRDASYFSAAGGVEGSWQKGSLQLAGGMQALLVRSDLEALSSSVPGINASTWRTQADFEVSRPLDLSSGVVLQPFVGAHLYREGGDDWLDAASIDTSAGMIVDWAGGMSAEFRARLQSGGGDVKEQSFAASISYDFGSDRRGLMFSASPNAVGNGNTPWQQSLEVEIGYGLPMRLFADPGLATFHAGLSDEKTSLADSYGLRFAGRRLEVDMSASGEKYSLGLKIR
ncbi:MAG: cadherin domain-containing protein, partial [Betaproteobacteria bacterium]|nr:cadherin domain-containing protein [Betaproteobacteria bacterium]